jgi:hypothetical protein
MRFFYVLVTAFFTLLSFESRATIYYYKVREGDRFENIYKSYFQTTYSGNEITEFEIDIKQFTEDLKFVNPQVTDWANLKSGTIVLIPDINFRKPKLSMGFYYTASQGSFTEYVRETNATVTSTQVSPITFGVMSQFQLRGSSFVIPASVYFATLNSSELTFNNNNGAAQKITIPNEYGANVYCQYSIPYSNFSPYAGFDFERITTFDMTAIQNSLPVDFRENNLFYLSAGTGYNFSYDRYRLHIKASISKTIGSSSSTGVSSDAFTGFRELLYFNIKKKDSPFVLHMFFKHHTLAGPTDLTVNRIGIGFGYFLF